MNPHNIPTQPDESGMDWVFGYFKKLSDLLFHPVTFFEKISLSESLSIPLAFALVSHWIGSALQYLHTGLFNSSGGMPELVEAWIKRNSRGFDQIHRSGRMDEWESIRHSFLEWSESVTSVLVDPFTTLIHIFFLSLLIGFVAKILITTKPESRVSRVEWNQIVRILAYAGGTGILLAIPLVGTTFYSLAWMGIAASGLRAVYHCSWFKALLIIGVPWLLLMMMIFFFVILVFLFFAGVMAAFA